jgi:hypothetical protein
MNYTPLLNFYASGKLHKVSDVPWALLHISPIIRSVSSNLRPSIVCERHTHE